MKKSILLLTATFAISGLFAQTRTTYGMFKKSDDSRIKGSGTAKGFEYQVIINNYTGGSDNSATIEIEVPMGIYISEFRNLMNTSNAASQPKTLPTATVANKPVVTNPNVIKQDIGIKATPDVKAMQSAQPAAPTLARMEISVTETKMESYLNRVVNKIIMEDLKVESCTDNASTGTCKIKLKANRIGWIYYNYDMRGNQSSSQSGWNTISGTAWTNF
ncbi:MAG: hypothetical protein M9904_07670 [Chitinophagaceae bacterium]|nr:hypothetical protein [Chitinophagaceae bacterium]